MEKLLTIDKALKNCPILLQLPVDPLYKYCKKKGIRNVNQLLNRYYKGNIDIKSNHTRTQLDGFIDLLLFFYFGDVSKEILLILNSEISNFCILSEHFEEKVENMFRRLGFASDQIKKFVKVVESQSLNTSIIHLLDCKYFPEKNQVSENICNKITLLQKMYKQTLPKEKVEEQEEQSKKADTIPLEDCGIFCTGTSANCLYKMCLSQGYSTIEMFLENHSFLYLNLMNRNDKMYLQGVVDLIHFQYYGKESKTIFDLLNSPFSIVKRKDSFFLSLQTQEIFLRLGFSSVHIRLIENQNLFVYRSCIRIIDFLIEEYKKMNDIPYEAGSVKATYFHIVSLLVRHFNPEERAKRIAYLKGVYGNLMDRAASFSKTAEEVQKEIQKLQREDKEIRLHKEKKE